MEYKEDNNTNHKVKMKVKIKRKLLLEASSKALSLASSSDESKYCRADVGEVLELSARNRISQAVFKVRLGKPTKEPFNFGIETKKLAQICKVAKCDEIEISITPSGKIRIKAGGATASLKNIEIAKTEFNSDHQTHVGGKDAVEAIVAASKFASDNESRRNLCGVSLRSGEDGFFITAADSFRAIQKELPKLSDDVNAIIDKKAIKEISAFANSEDVNLMISERWFFIDIQGDVPSSYKTLLLDAEFPNIRSILTSESEPFTVNVGQLSDRLSFLSAWDEVSILGEVGTKFLFSNGGLNLVSKDNDQDDDQEPIKTTGETPILEIGMNAKFVIDSIAILNQIGVKEASIKLTGENKAFIIEIEKSSLIIALMPLKLRW